MSTDLQAAAVRASRSPQLVIAELTARKASRSAVVWGLVFGLYVVSSAAGYAAAYKTPAERAQLVATFGANLGFNALIGPAHNIGTVGGFTAWRALGVLSILGAVWGLLTATRLLRGEEDAGRWEMLLVGQTTRRTATAKALAGLGVGLVTLWAITVVMTIAVGQASSIDIGADQAVFFALALVCSAAIFLAVGALASQLAPTRRQAAAFAAGALGVCYALRMVADSGTGFGWLRAVSPLGWVEELHPLTDPDALLLVPIGGLVAALCALSIHLAGIRDLAASIVADHPDARPRVRLLNGPVGLAVRLSRAVTIGWAVSILLGALLMGLISKSVGDALSADAGDRKEFAKLGFRGSGASQYLSITFLIVALLVALEAIGQVSAMRREEAEGRVDHLLVRPVSRHSWLLGRLAVVAVSALAMGVLAGITAWVGAASQGAGVGFGSVLDAGLNVVPPALIMVGAGALTFGIWPRAVSTVSYGLLAWSFLVELLGGVINASHWVMDTSVFHQMASAPSASPNWVTNSILIAVALAAAAGGTLAFSRRDLAGE